ncbi:MAG: four helix bundle protein [Chitinophagaceae bacterium]|nr:MAG: four helix bundle protein [Chitinophagaceae bacterium]
MRDFRKLDVWMQALLFVKKVYDITYTFPQKEQYGLVSQMNRCAVSMPSNIAEGCSRKTSADFSRFLDIALGSSFELETQIEVSYIIAYINIDQYASLMQELHIIQKRINALKNSIIM